MKTARFFRTCRFWKQRENDVMVPGRDEAGGVVITRSPGVGWVCIVLVIAAQVVGLVRFSMEIPTSHKKSNIAVENVG